MNCEKMTQLSQCDIARRFDVAVLRAFEACAEALRPLSLDERARALRAVAAVLRIEP